MTIDPAWAELRQFPPVTPTPAAPTHTPLGARLRERTQQLAKDDAPYGYAHAHLCEAMMRGGIELSQAFDPPDPWAPFEPVLDPAACPPWALPWLAQLAGVTFTGSMTTDDQRNAIVTLQAQQRGKVSMLRAAVLPLLTGTQTMYFRERDGGDAYALEVVTLTSETPDPAAVKAALLARLPAGLTLDFHTVVGWDYQAWTDDAAARGETYRTNSPHYVTYSALTDNIRT